MTIDNETESVLRESFKVILGEQYRDDLHLCRLAGLVENRLLTLKNTEPNAKAPPGIALPDRQAQKPPSSSSG